MDFKAKMAAGSISAAGLLAIVGPLAESMDKWADVNLAFVANWNVDTWQLVLGTVIGGFLGGPALVLSEIVRQATLKGFGVLGIDLSKILGNGVALVLVCLALGCGGNSGTDAYYSTLSALAGVRSTAIEACKLDAVPKHACQSMHDQFFVPGDQAIATAEQARQAVAAACPTPGSGLEPSAECIGAGVQLKQALAGVSAVSASLTSALAAHGVGQ